MNQKRNIYLIGFMGSGKSTVGAMLGPILNAPFFDLDHLIEQQEGRSIPELFQEEGENYFRNLERKVLKQTWEWPAHVMALGGGAFESEENRRMVGALGTTVWLSVSIEQAWNRCQENCDRPLARDRNRFRHLFQSRLQNYGKADIRIETGNKSPAEICKEILAKLKSLSVY